ncbi:unnamed protein product [Pedinophyceae sp. YPF-701]|nr:unnamed protein product [Pedinophyceae sp. YPF-701]
MSGTLAEGARCLHEDLERLERRVVGELKDVASHSDRLAKHHRARKMLEAAQQRAAKLQKIYEDDDGLRREEIARLARSDGRGTATQAYFERVAQLREYHRKLAQDELTEEGDNLGALVDEAQVEFTGPEAGGRYLDLNALHIRFVNATFADGKHPDYLEYLRTFSDFSAIAPGRKLGAEYREYLEALLAYLSSFYTRTNPLGQVEKRMAALEQTFPEEWAAREDAHGSEDAAAKVAHICDLHQADSPADVAQFGPDALKDALQALGLKCGGTPQQRAERLFSVKGRRIDEIDRKLFAKGAGPGPASQTEKARKAAYAVALLERKVVELRSMLAAAAEATVEATERKQVQTYEELEAERAAALEEEEPEGDGEEGEDDSLYNPLKIPLGWDGKPIPVWLYKLHGLNQEFECEICGNFSYRGRRAFERHFTEWRHQQGMRSLGIPNSKEFFEVTRIKDALELWSTLRKSQAGGFNPNEHEEYEDGEGNVYSKRTFEDLKREGLI